METLDAFRNNQVCKSSNLIIERVLLGVSGFMKNLHCPNNLEICIIYLFCGLLISNLHFFFFFFLSYISFYPSI